MYSPDGKHMAFLRQTIKFFSADRHRLMVLDRDSGTKTELAAAFNRSCQHPNWADAKRLAFEAENGGTTGIYLINLGGKMPSTDPPPVSERSIDLPAAGAALSTSRVASTVRQPWSHTALE